MGNIFTRYCDEVAPRNRGCSNETTTINASSNFNPLKQRPPQHPRHKCGSLPPLEEKPEEGRSVFAASNLSLPKVENSPLSTFGPSVRAFRTRILNRLEIGTNEIRLT